MSWRTWLIGVVAISGFIWAFGPFGPRYVRSMEDHKVYFRLLAKYQHEDETIDFDVVAGCGVRVTRYGDGDSSYDASRDPVIFAKRTRDGGAIWQIMPGACGGETTENGLVPKDFLPGALWFDNADDFSFGIAYVTEDAFENPKSKLKFLGASVHKATREEWEAFQPVAATNLVDSRPFTWGNPKPTDPKEILANLWNKEEVAAWRPAINCYFVQRYHLTDPAAQRALRQHWPSSQPRFWMPQLDQYRSLNEKIKNTEFNGVPQRQIFSFGHYQSRAFPTRTGGGMLGSGRPGSQFPSEIFPLRSDDGIPWLNRELGDAPIIYRDIDLDGGRNRGFAYCYSSFRLQDWVTQLYLPNYFERTFRTRIDGAPIFGEENQSWLPNDAPGPFYERDQYLYRFTVLAFY